MTRAMVARVYSDRPPSDPPGRGLRACVRALARVAPGHGRPGDDEHGGGAFGPAARPARGGAARRARRLARGRGRARPRRGRDAGHPQRGRAAGRGLSERPERRIVPGMGEVLLVILGPTAVFGLFALLCMRFGAESRPYFDERPVVDDRPNWFPIAGAGGGDGEEDDDAGPPDAERVPDAA